MKEKIGAVLVILSLVFMVYVVFLFADDYISQDTTGGVMITNTTTGESSIIMDAN